MARSRSSSPGRDYLQEIQDFVSELAQSPEKEAVVSEIEVLQSIYGEDSIRVYHANGHNGKSLDPDTVRYEVNLSLPSPREAVYIKILVSLAPSYPSSTSPQLQLLSKYIGAFGVDPDLFGAILRTYISVSGVEFVPDQVCVFDGVQNVLDRCTTWYEEQLSLEKAGQLVRKELKESGQNNRPPVASQAAEEGIHDSAEQDHENLSASELPPGVDFFVAEPIVDRKSSFVGRACKIEHPSQVPQIIAFLLEDRRIARAAHPVINAWRCQVGNLLHQDNDDDGETAAGGRLAHLLQILEVNNVLVIVTRYFGGIHLGPDRFKHINQAARNALEIGGFLDSNEPSSNKKHVGRKKH
ncbi:imprinted and ancient [Coprinopsis marcescibilis]|uniref:Imprinted and ancient n=1 Tax=Coprinopsis marcescibilis TaxID=230819 RepID=A0A5C3KZY3_COPMA|nr:imprinted and ancient [Coprinopsis marcescibilis]